MRCVFCGAGPAQGETLIRINPKGEKGVWACRAHVGRTVIKVPPIVDEIERALHDDEARP